jgi:hypothetical protein
MQNNDSAAEQGGVRFFDRSKRDRGWASCVTKRAKGLSFLTVIDVVGADSELAIFLAHLDRSHLVVRQAAGGAALFDFRWASGYVNGPEMRIQGVLEAR